MHSRDQWAISTGKVIERSTVRDVSPGTHSPARREQLRIRLFHPGCSNGAMSNLRRTAARLA
jgi:hypothetical protein